MSAKSRGSEDTTGVHRTDVDADAVLRAVNPPTRRRILVAVCFPLLLLLCLPYWWYTTSIVRLPLPKDQIVELEHTRTPSIQTQIWLTADDAVFVPSPPGKVDYPNEVKLEYAAKTVHDGVDSILARSPPASRGERRWELVTNAPLAPLRAHISVDASANSSFPLRPYIKADDGGIKAQDGSRIPQGALVIPVHPGQVSDRRFGDLLKVALINGIHYILPEHLPEITQRALAYSPNVTLTFVVLNEDSGSGSFVDGWDVQAAIRDHFAPHLEPLAPVFNFSIESQVLYHAPLTFEPTRREDGTWVIDDEHMKIFISERWSLDSGSTNNPVLRFLLFVPSAEHRPMTLGERDSKAFLVPQVGSVILLNPPELETGAYHLKESALDGVFEQYLQHFYNLLALPPKPSQLHQDPYAKRAEQGLSDPLSPYQLDTILRMRLKENSAEARTTLAGIVRLVDKIKEMKVGPGVRDKVLGSVRRLQGLPAAARAPGPLEAFILSRDAVGLANEAFFDPSMMGLLYFPDEHKFAVYTPLFAPIGISMVVALLRELVAWKKRRAAAKKAQSEVKVVTEPSTKKGRGKSRVEVETEVEASPIEPSPSSRTVRHRK